MKKLITIAFILLFASSALAQSMPSIASLPDAPTPKATAQAAAPVSSPVVASCAQANIGVEYIHFSNGMSGTMEEAAHPFTDCTKKYILSAGFAMIQVPAANTSFYIVGPRIDLPLSNFGMKLDSVLQSLTLFAGGGLGTAQVAPPNLAQTNHFAYGAHGGISISPGSLFGISTQFQIEAGVVGYNRTAFKAVLLPSSSGQVAAAVIFNLGSKAPSVAQQKANAPGH
jgi:hypothetical protein